MIWASLIAQLVKKSACNGGDPSSIPGLGRSAGEGIGYLTPVFLDFPLAQLVKNLPAIWETQVESLGWEDALEKEMATCSSILVWEIPRMEESGGLQPMGSQRVGGGRKESDTTEQLHSKR